MEPGYYFVFFPNEGIWTIGYYRGSTFDDGSPNKIPWEVIGSDEIFRDDDGFLMPGPKVSIPAHLNMEVRE